MRFNLEQLTAFIASVEQGSFSAAARHLGKAQSAVSTAVANLEVDLGLTLFDRSHREATLTTAGEALLPQARALLAQASLLEGRADAIAAGEEGSLSLAVEESLIGDTLDDLLCRFEQAFPHVELELLTPARVDIIDLISRGRVNIGLMITTFDAPDGFRIHPLGEMTLITACGAQHALARLERVSFEELMQHRQLILTSRQGEMSPKEQISHQVWKIESQFGLIDLLKRGLGWAWLPEHMARPWIRQGLLVQLQLHHDVSRFHMPVDLLTSPTYREGIAGQWLTRELAGLDFLTASTS